MALIEKIKEKAIGLGFALAGVTTPAPPPHWPVFQNWLALGRNGSMGYLRDPRRADPHLVMSECKSILMLALRHPEPAGASDSPPQGRIAAYAQGDDYHLVLPDQLKALAEFISQEAGKPVSHRLYTDAAPLLERDLAQRAGLGWIGKNTCLINPQIGSTFLLAELLLDLALEPDEPFAADRCGSCTRCIDACPTGCILPDRTLDARRCISYLTIENKGEIPPGLRQQVGDWLFGCDVCQQVCPWNQRKKATGATLFEPHPAIAPTNLSDELLLTGLEFDRKFKHSPIRRARRSGYLRNLCVVVGNRKDQSAIPVLERLAGEEDELVSRHAGWALDRIRNGKSN